jgi:hypothetical protein
MGIKIFLPSGVKDSHTPDPLLRQPNGALGIPLGDSEKKK